MTWGGAAALIAAIAFAVLVVFLVLLVRELTTTIKNVSQTVEEVNDTLAVLRRDVDDLSIEAQGLLNKTNVLMDDVNGKVSTVDPLFKAIGALGVSVSDVNDATRDLVVSIRQKDQKAQDKSASQINSQLSAGTAKEKSGAVEKLGQTAKRLKQKRYIRKVKEASESKAF
ncbi:DUF948 domain-containing protein [Aerococcus sanguinicola]|uniref:DUF948 domain-containing protein n=1 Tax=Aerococcus sanguinicola TaxID=119206 RepID=A0A2I1MTG3_9LACT|nr:DUF948 domain-containing protein [Aerococcus sanguinicola]PKZ23342.1 DUF948 domain-containing protein [Aerococcus sanguinicola]